LISKVIDIDGTSVCYEYYDQKPYRLKSVVEYGMNNHKGASFKLEYGHKSTTIIDNKDRATVISYNDYANPVSASNLKSKDDISNAYGTDYNYGEWEEYKNKLISNKIPVKHVNNFLKNTSFESDTILFSSTENVVLSISNECSYSGSKSLKIVNTSETGKVFQTITVDKGNNYTFSAFVKNNNPLKFKLSYTNEDGVAVEKEGEIINIDEDFNRYDVTMFYPKDAISDLCINFEMLAPGVTYIDNVQLEEGEVANHFNYIENSDFRMGLGDLNYDSNDNDMSHFEVVTLSDGKSKALKINMDPEYDTYISKEFKVSGQAGDEYNISFWYKNKGIIPANDGPLNGSAVWLRAVYTDPDDWHTQHCVPINHLNPSEDEWQYFSASYTTESAYDGFVIDFGQSGDANELYITNLSLFKSVGSSGYDYDIKGNLTSVIGTNKETNNFVYDVNNQLVKSINPKGKKLMYEYDNDIQGRLLRNISEMGICNEMKYDSRDNCTLSRINKKGITNTITDDLYKIRNKGTSLYLRNIVNSIQLKDNCQCHDLWKLEKVEDYYKISHSIVPNKYFTVQNNKLILSPFNGDNSLFTLLENSNGSYSIQLKETSEYIKNNNNELIATAYVYDNPAFEFYFEPNDEQHFMETNYEFTEDGRFIKSVTDTNLNKLTYDIDSVTGLTRSTTNSKNQTSVYQYDDKHRLLSIKVNDDRQVIYTYNDYNLLDKIKFGTKEYNFTYDDFMNNKTLRINNDITLLTNNYEDNNGNLLSSIYGNNHAIGYDYDEFDRIKKINRMDNIYQFKYGNNGDLLKVIDNSHAIKFSYDLGKRLTEYRTDRFHFKNTSCC
ncbi:MAG: hypothetical protein HFH45_06805, partial [Bacilli bacterium]|nr:hypothetical protein [Bacilli bacterium]